MVRRTRYPGCKSWAGKPFLPESGSRTAKALRSERQGLRPSRTVPRRRNHCCPSRPPTARRSRQPHPPGLARAGRGYRSPPDERRRSRGTRSHQTERPAHPGSSACGRKRPLRWSPLRCWMIPGRIRHLLRVCPARLQGSRASDQCRRRRAPRSRNLPALLRPRSARYLRSPRRGPLRLRRWFAGRRLPRSCSPPTVSNPALDVLPTPRESLRPRERQRKRSQTERSDRPGWPLWRQSSVPPRALPDRWR